MLFGAPGSVKDHGTVKTLTVCDSGEPGTVKTLTVQPELDQLLSRTVQSKELDTVFIMFRSV